MQAGKNRTDSKDIRARWYFLMHQYSYPQKHANCTAISISSQATEKFIPFQNKGHLFRDKSQNLPIKDNFTLYQTFRCVIGGKIDW